MTRDEAIELESGFVRSDSAALEVDHMVDDKLIRKLAAINVERYVSFGMLKLDEPKKLSDKLLELVSDTRLVKGERHERMLWLFIICDELGLKIVEK